MRKNISALDWTSDWLLNWNLKESEKHTEDLRVARQVKHLKVFPRFTRRVPRQAGSKGKQVFQRICEYHFYIMVVQNEYVYWMLQQISVCWFTMMYSKIMTSAFWHHRDGKQSILYFLRIFLFSLQEVSRFCNGIPIGTSLENVHFVLRFGFEMSTVLLTKRKTGDISNQKCRSFIVLQMYLSTVADFSLDFHSQHV